MKRRDMKFRDKWLKSLSDEERLAVEQLSESEETDLYSWWLEDQLPE